MLNAMASGREVPRTSIGACSFVRTAPLSHAYGILAVRRDDLRLASAGRFMIPLISVLDKDLFPPFADRRQQGKEEHDGRHRKKPGADRMIKEGHHVAARDDESSPQVLLHQL